MTGPDGDADVLGTAGDGGTTSCGTGPGMGAKAEQAENCVNWYEAFAFCFWGGGFLA